MRRWNTTHANLMDPNFWLQPAGECDSGIAQLHAEAPLDWFEEPLPDNPYLQAGPGYWCVTRHEDIATISRNPDIYSSAQGITITDTPPEFLEFFSSMIAMDDPRHARLRRIVSKGFTPRMLAALEDSVQSVAAGIVDDIAERGKLSLIHI